MAFPSVEKGNQSGEIAKHPRPGIPLNRNDILALIPKHRGNLSKIADCLGTTRGCVRRRCQDDPELKEALEDARERWIDDIEVSVLSRADETNDTALQCFVLKTQGRHRGWDQDEVKNTAKDIATAAFDYIVNKSKNPAEPTK